MFMLITERLKEQKDFSKVDTVIADYFLNEENEWAEKSLRQIAQLLFVSPSSVVRLCQKIGFEGFLDFRTAYLHELDYLSSDFGKIDINYPFDIKDRNTKISGKLKNLYIETIKDTFSLLGHDALALAESLLVKADDIYICSAGAPSELARAFQEKMIKIGKNVIIDHRLDVLFYQACYAKPDSVFLFISYSGETETLLRIAHKLKERKLQSIALTSYGGNSLSDLATVTLYLSTHESLVHNIGNFSLFPSVLFLLDVLYANVFSRNYEKHLADKIRYTKEYEKRRKSYNPLLSGGEHEKDPK